MAHGSHRRKSTVMQPVMLSLRGGGILTNPSAGHARRERPMMPASALAAIILGPRPHGSC